MAHNDQIPNYSSSSDDDEEEEASGSEDEQTSGSDSEETSDSASDVKPSHEPKKPLISPPKSTIKPPNPDLCSSESEESGSGTDSDSPVQKPAVDIKVKPSVSKSMEREGLNLESKLAVPPVNKRPSVAPVVNEKDPKKAKKNVVTTDDDSKKQLFQRLWSEEDEIVILKGMIDYKAENGEISIVDMGAFHEIIKKSLHVDVTRAQLVDKIRRLKKKFVNKVSKEKNGKDRCFSKSHEQKGYELSKLIWGGGSPSGVTEAGKKNQSQKNGNAAGTSGGNAASTSGGKAANLVKSNGLDDKEGLVMGVEKKMDISRFVRYGGRDESPVLPEEILKAGVELVEGSKRVELEERLRSLKKQELELYLKKMDLIKEQALVVLEAVNSSGN